MATTFATIRAGRLNLAGTRVTADARKGTLQILQDEDSLVHLQWLDRTSGAVEDDIIIVPGEATFTRVNQCKTGRVYVLKYSQEKRFFWIQEPKEEKDNEIVPIIQRVLATGSNAPVGAAGASANVGGMGGGGAAARGMAAMASNLGLDQDTLMSIIRASAPQAHTPAPAPAPAPASAAAASTGGVSAESLQQMIQGLAAAMPPQAPQEPGLNLRDVLAADDVIPLLAANPDVVAAVAGDLPEEERSPERVADLLRSPQFAQALGSLTGVLHSGQGDAVIRSLGLEGRPTLNADAVRVFLEAIQRKADSSSPSGGGDTEMRDA